MDKNSTQVIQNEKESRFEVEGKIAYLEYMERSTMIVFPHTEVPDEMEGQGIGKLLVVTALDWAKKKEKRIVPTCPFVASYIGRHPEYQSMLAPGYRI